MAIIKNKVTNVSDSGSNKKNNNQKNTARTNNAVYGSNYGGAATQNNNTNRNLYGSNYSGAKAQNVSTQKNTQTQRKTVFDYLKSYGTNSQGAAKTSVANNLYGSNYGGARANQIQTTNTTGENRYKNVLQTIDKNLGSPMQKIFSVTNKILNQASDYLEESNQMTDLQKHHLDTTFSGYVDVDPVYSKIKNDRTYASKLADEQGNLIDYTDQITKLEGQIHSTANLNEKKALKQQIDLLKEYQADQKKLQYASYYDYLQKNGASEEDLIAFKRDVIRDNYSGIERTLANFTSTVQSHVGNMVKGYETLYAKASDLFGEEYQMSGYVDKIIDEAETLRQYSMQGAGGMEKLVYEVYDGMAPFLYSLMTAQFMSGNTSYLGNEEAAKALNNRALLMSDVSTLGSKMKQNLDKGYDFDTSFNNAFLSAGLSHITESIGGESLANILTGKIGEELLENTLGYAIKALSNQFLAEATEEGMEAFVEPIIDKYTLNTGLTVEGYIKQAFSKDTAYQMLIGGLGGLAMGSIGTLSTIEDFNSIVDSIQMDSKADYNAAIEARNKLQEIVQKAEQSGSNTETDEAQIHNSKLLISAFNKKINRYAAANPYMDAFVSASDNANTHLDVDPKSTILNAAAPDVTSKLDEILQEKGEINEQSQMAVETMQEDLNRQGINASATDMSSMSEEAATTARQVNDWAKATNKKVGFANLVSKSGEVIDGIYDSNSGQTLINPNGKNGIISTLIHEFTHGTESSKYYSLLHGFVKEYLGDNYQTAIENIKDEYSTVQSLDDEGAVHELVAITTQDLLGNEEFVDRLVRYDTSLAYRMYEEIRYANEHTGGALEGIEQNFMRAFNDMREQPHESGKTQYAFTAERLNGERVNLEVKSSFADAVDSVLNDTINPKSDHVLVSEKTNDILLKYVDILEDLPMLIEIGKIRSALGYKSGNNNIHHISETFIKNISEEMNNPKMIFWNAQQHSVNMLLFDENNQPVIVAIKPNGRGRYNNVEIITNRIATVFNVDKELEAYLNDSASKIYYPLEGTKKEVIARVVANTATKPASTSTYNIAKNNGKNNTGSFQRSIGLNISNVSGDKSSSSRRKDLMAIHNLSESNLMRSLDLGGFAVPSIAVTKDSIGHDSYGDISLVFGKDTIDPSKKGNKVYGGDAWTGTYPNVEYEADYDSARQVGDYLRNIADSKVIRDIDNSSNHAFYKISDPNQLSDFMNERRGDISDDAKKSDALQYLFLTEKGQGFDAPYVDKSLFGLNDPEMDQLMLQRLIENGFTKQDEGISWDYAKRFAEPVRKILNEIYAKKFPKVVDKRGEFYREGDFGAYDAEKYLKAANKYLIEGSLEKRFDSVSFKEMLSDAKKQYDGNFDSDYTAWVNDLLSRVSYKTGIRNSKDTFTSSGSRRSFDVLHDPYTLENIMKFMKKQAGSDSRGKHEGVFGIGAGDIQATQKISFKDIKDIISHESMLQNLTDDEVKTVIKPSMDKIGKVANTIEEIFAENDKGKFGNSVDHQIMLSNNAYEFLKDAIRKNTKEQMVSLYQREYAPYESLRMTDEQLSTVLDEIIGLKGELANMPTRYFEAKPERIVGLNEIQAAVIPNTASSALKQRLADMGINTIEYDPSVEGDRAAKVNSLESLKFSKGLKLENLISDVRKDLRNFGEKDRKVNLTETLNKAVNDIRETGEVSQDVYNELREKVVESTRAKVPNGGYDDAQAIRRMIGNNFGRLRKDRWDVQLQELNDTFHMYDEHEVGINSYQDAQNFIDDYLAGLGEKYIYEDPVEMGYLSRMEYEDMVDNKLDEVITNLKNSINDQNVAENVADMLTNDDIEENMYRQGQENLDALLNEENDLLDRIEQASVGNLTPEELDTLEQESLEKISIEEAKQQVSPVLKEAATIKKPLRSVKDIMYQVRQKIFDKGIAIRDMKNRQLSVSYDTMLNADNMANYAILNGVYDSKGKKVADSLTSASKMIPESQKNDFDYYMYHKHNIDAAKIGKPVFMNFDSAKSQQIVNQYEMQYPEWKNVAQKYYDLNDQMLKKQVEHGVISQEMADHWKELYPHYVPTKRFMGEVNEENVVETADPQMASSNKGTLYERTGGTSPIQPLDYAMAEHIKQIYKSTLFNDFARDYIKASHSATNVFNEQRYIEEMVEASEDKVTKADEYTPATLIWYNNGERNIVEIPQNIYDAVKPSETLFNLPSNVPFLAWATKLRTNMITGANPVFWATNAVKDFQDIAFNSKYAKDTYLNLPRAYAQLLKGGEIANLYKSMGGEYQTYSSEAGINQNEHGKFYNATIGNFVKFNELVEMAPRLAEFMSSLDHGDSVETAMYNAAEVTTNFKRGGDYAKWINRNGVNFFNASIQGFDKQIRNIEDAYDSKGWKGIVSYMAKSTLLSGVPLVLLNGLLHRGDKDYEELSDYIKDNYYILWKYDDGKFVRIPKGRIANAYQGIMSALYKDGVELASDNDALTKAQNIWNNTLDGFVNIWEQVGVNNPLENNIFSPLVQTINNEAWYGDPIVSTYMQKKDPADQYDESTDLLSVWLGQKTNVSPMKINYLIDQYSGGAGDFILPYLTPKAETGLRDGTAAGEVTSFFISPYADKFTTDSVFKNQKVSDFFTLDEELTKMAQKEHASDETILSSKYINSIQKQMNDLYAEKREIQKDTSLSDAQKYERARSVQEQINELARTGLDTYDQIDMDSYYGSVGGISYSKKNDEWSKVDADKEAMLNELGASTKEKSDYFYTVNTISEIRKDIKDETPEGEKAEYKNATINAIETSGLNPKMQNYLYDTYYSGKLTDNVNAMDISDEDKLAIKIANSKGVAAKDANGKTISNSKALSTADAYADAGVLDDVFDYIRENGLSPSDFGLTKTVYNYSYDGMAKAYQSVFGQQFGTGEATDDEIRSINSSYTSSGKSSGSSKRSSKKSSKSSSGSGLSKKEEARRKKFRKAILAFLKANRYNTSDLSDVLKGTTRLSDVEAKVKKAINS